MLEFKIRKEFLPNIELVKAFKENNLINENKQSIRMDKNSE